MNKKSRSVKEKVAVVGIVALFLLTVVVSGAALAQKKAILSIAAGGTGGVWYPYGGAMASVISKYIPGC